MKNVNWIMKHESTRLTRRSTLKTTASGIAGVGITGLAGCTDDDGAEVREITIASTFEPGHVLVEAAEIFADEIEEETDGSFDVEVVPGGAYGAEDEIADQVQDGTPQMHVGGGVPFSMFASDYYFYDTPFVIEDLDHFRRVEESDEFEGAYEQLREQGNQRKIGQFIYRGMRHFTSNEPVYSPEDVEGMGLRLPELDSWVSIWEEIGVDATPVALDELYSALQQGVAEASEGDAEQIHSFNLEEVQDHLSLTGHMVQTGGMYVNEEFFQGLDESIQDAVLDIAADATAEASQQAEDEEDDLIHDLADQGMEIVEDVEQDAFQERAEPAVEELFAEEWEGNWDEWRNV